MHFEPFCTCLEDACVYLPVECLAQPAGVSVRVVWQLGRYKSHVPAGLEYSIKDRSWISVSPPRVLT